MLREAFVTGIRGSIESGGVRRAGVNVLEAKVLEKISL